METNYFDPAKSIEGLAQFDQAAANSALAFSANFITQIDALAGSLQTMADTAAAALTTAFSTGAVAMSESVGASILDIITKIQEMQISGSEALTIFSETAIATFAAINENFLVQADTLNLKFAETALAIETNLLVSLSNIELAFFTAFVNILTELLTKQEEFNAIFSTIEKEAGNTTANIEASFITVFSNILTELETKKAEIGEQLLEIEQLFATTSENAKLDFTDNLTIIKETFVSFGNTAIQENTNVITSFEQVKGSGNELKENTGNLLDSFNEVVGTWKNVKSVGEDLIKMFGLTTPAIKTNNAVTQTAGSTSGSAALKVLEFGAGVLMVGSGVLLAGMAIALLAKVAFNTFKMFGMNTHGVKADDFNLKFEIPGLADGGIPGYGELFIAREAGPEFVGSFGSRNVVMNNNQIVDAVSGGVYDAVRRANAEQSQQPIYLNVEAKVRENVLFDMMETVRAERGVRLSTGGAWYKKSIRNTLFHIATEMPKGGVRYKAGQLPWPPLAKSIILFHSLHIT